MADWSILKGRVDREDGSLAVIELQGTLYLFTQLELREARRRAAGWVKRPVIPEPAPLVRRTGKRRP